MGIAYVHDKRLAVLMAFPSILLMLSVYQNATLLVSLYGVWFQMSALVMLILLIFVVSEADIRPLLAILVLGVLLTFTVAAGLVIWPIIFLSMPFYGYRKWWQYALTLVVGTLAVFLWMGGFNLTEWLASAETERTVIQLSYLTFVRSYLENIFADMGTFNILKTALMVLSALLVTLNTLLLGRDKGRRRKIAPWVGLIMFVVGASLVKYMGRAYANPPAWYITCANLYWVGVVAINSYTFLYLYNQPTRSLSSVVYMWCIVLCQVGVVGLSLFTQISHLTVMQSGQGNLTFQRDDYSYIEQCALDYLFEREYNCQTGYSWGGTYTYLMDGLAVRGLAVYGDIERQQVLPNYNGEPIVIDVESYNFSLVIHRFLLADIPEDNLILIHDDVLDGQTESDFAIELADEADTVWYIRNQRTASLEAALLGEYRSAEQLTVNNLIVQKLSRLP
ncbi:MAG: hypothetical protein AAFQ52_11405, partial [Chloroflexota bacterium]